MSRGKKRQGGDRGAAGNSSEAGSRAAAATCGSCNRATLPDARYCHHCGAPLQGGVARKPRDPAAIALYAVIAVCIAAAAAGIVFIAIDNQSKPRPVAVDRSPEPAEPSVDLSSMSPRQAADRLFNRVMMAQEQGNTDEIMLFAPKTLQAYDMVGNLDADAHYHIGLVHAAVGDFDKVRKQVGILKQFSPNHLLGLMLEHSAAEEAGDKDAAVKAYAAFAAAYESEIRTGKPEYAAHRNSIDSFLTDSGG